jgi:hypothetical protein
MNYVDKMAANSGCEEFQPGPGSGEPGQHPGENKEPVFKLVRPYGARTFKGHVQ